MERFLFTSESVTRGHPDKVADQISDAILDVCLEYEQESKVACETLVSAGLVVLAGEISSQALPHYDQIVKEVVSEIGYNDPSLGFHPDALTVITSIKHQSPDISQGVEEGKGLFREQGAGDQGIMFGFACDETPALMPMPIMLAHELSRELVRARESGDISYLRPDGKTQVTVAYDENGRPDWVHTIVISTQHAVETDYETICQDMQKLARSVIPAELLRDETKYYINPTGRFVVGGPLADSGLTGRKIIVDTYGGMGRHGGGCFSGKDPSKVDRSAAYAARYVAKNIVAAGLARKCEVQLSYAIGVAHPISIKIDTFNTGAKGITDGLLAKMIPDVFDLSPKGMIEMLNLKRAIYKNTAWGGHFGFDSPNYTWEKTDKIKDLQAAKLLQMGQKPSRKDQVDNCSGLD
jgi:S-adenosylmethionine synthetase